MIRVMGSGRATAAPDIVRVRLTATALRPSLAVALADSEDAAGRLRAALLAHGVGPDDAITLSLAVRSEQEWNGQMGSQTTGFRSDHDLAVTLRDLPSSGRVLGEVLIAGGDDVRLDGVDFLVEDDAPLRVRAREAAWQDATSRATQLASLAGRRLGVVQEISEESGFAGPIHHSRNLAMARSWSAAPELGVHPGSVGVEVSLFVQWAID